MPLTVRPAGGIRKARSPHSPVRTAARGGRPKREPRVKDHRRHQGNAKAGTVCKSWVPGLEPQLHCTPVLKPWAQNQHPPHRVVGEFIESTPANHSVARNWKFSTVFTVIKERTVSRDHRTDHHNPPRPSIQITESAT
jgi:hypothetical protein